MIIKAKVARKGKIANNNKIPGNTKTPLLGKDDFFDISSNFNCCKYTTNSFT